MSLSLTQIVPVEPGDIRRNRVPAARIEPPAVERRRLRGVEPVAAAAAHQRLRGGFVAEHPAGKVFGHRRLLLGGERGGLLLHRPVADDPQDRRRRQVAERAGGRGAIGAGVVARGAGGLVRRLAERLGRVGQIRMLVEDRRLLLLQLFRRGCARGLCPYRPAEQHAPDNRHARQRAPPFPSRHRRSSQPFRRKLAARPAPVKAIVTNPYDTIRSTFAGVFGTCREQRRT